jgi:hypothetical protein
LIEHRIVEHDRGGRQCRLELLNRARADDHGRHRSVRGREGERELRKRQIDAGSEFNKPFDEFELRGGRRVGGIKACRIDRRPTG